MLDINSLPIEIKYVGEVLRENWKCDQWQIVIKSSRSKVAPWYTDYFTGLGLRNSKTGRPRKPKIGDVLHALFLDAKVAEYNFDDWCAEYGHDGDSIRALTTYKACLEIASQLKTIFTQEEREAIQAAVADW